MVNSIVNSRELRAIAALLMCYDAEQVERTPWCDDIISPETNLVLTELIDANRHGFLTINSQPRVNATPSSDPVVGWGNPGGYIFQKVIHHVVYFFPYPVFPQNICLN